MSRAARDLGLSFTGVDPAAMECLRAYPWPGNIAELKRETELMVLFSRNGRVVLEDLPVYLRMATDAFLEEDDEAPPLTQEAERFQLARAMARCSGDLEAVADLLGQKPENVILKMRLFGLDPIDYQAPLKAALPKGPGQTTVPA
jgi:transcriptional activator for dhaKLM operon